MIEFDAESLEVIKWVADEVLEWSEATEEEKEHWDFDENSDVFMWFSRLDGMPRRYIDLTSWYGFGLAEAAARQFGLFVKLIIDPKAKETFRYKVYLYLAESSWEVNTYSYEERAESNNPALALWTALYMYNKNSNKVEIDE